LAKFSLREYVIDCLEHIYSAADIDDAEFVQVCRCIGSMSPETLHKVIELRISPTWPDGEDESVETAGGLDLDEVVVAIGDRGEVAWPTERPP
jgi:hypothetical protein